MTKTRPAIPSDIPGILALQERNLLSNLSEAEQKNGFVTTAFTVAQIEELLRYGGVFVAVETSAHDQSETVTGYALAGTWAFFAQWPIFPFMLGRLPALHFEEQAITEANSFQYGPVCVDAAYRGLGVFPRLFEAMRLGMCERYSIGATAFAMAFNCLVSY
ncbi:GNAT family acetyltransferase [Undibacterium flavidum]|uniref:GNAT family acetyltransferase n=1 Tax=Undibacterium flavidum TaxID=2762297 RepID=A0ABR6Y794_9BURK|nr:GNAT family acetyltransferase [Undibacterium flavidum]MBC3872478.1 GNAT family acetyltransferase [Undibacterium flavidum]